MKLLIVFLVCQCSFIADAAVIPYSELGETDRSSPADRTGSASEITTATPVETRTCTQMEMHCESCSHLVMCVESEYGFLKQRVTCPLGTTCLVDKCIRERNPLCDGTASIPFECHVTGIFPDPFDCRKYHICVPLSNQVIDYQMNLTHYMIQCPADGNTEYRFDVKTAYCKYKLEKGCPKWPVPFCNFGGETGALQENESIFYVCDSVQDYLYPHLYVCPHGEIYNAVSEQCGLAAEKKNETTTLSWRRDRWNDY